MKLGEKQVLTVVKIVDFGVYLGNDEERVLLPKKQVPEGIEPGDPVEVFLYRDSSDRLIATTNEPKLTMGHLAVLEVADTGIGISPEHLPQIFTCFYRADPSRNKEIAGNGLGLSIVKTAVEKMQGEITVESQEGKGTCFHVTLPA